MALQPRGGDGLAVVANHCGSFRVVQLQLPPPPLGPQLLQQWGLDVCKPATIELRFHAQYVDGPAPTVRIYKEHFGEADWAVRRQLVDVVQRFVDELWRRRDVNGWSAAEISEPRGNAKRRRSKPEPNADNFDETAADGKPTKRAQADLGGAQLAPCSFAEGDSGRGVLAKVSLYAAARVAWLHAHCPICDAKHVFGCSAVPSVCGATLCAFRLSAFGNRITSATERHTESQVVDLLIAVATLAVRSQRKIDIFDPYPAVFEPCGAECFHPERPDFDRLSKALEGYPSVERMEQLGTMSEIKKDMDGKNADAHPLLQWLISSNRAHVVTLPPGRLLGAVATPHPYVLKTATPDKETRFQQLKMQFGSSLAWHGSSPENWHSVLRNGLRNASGTKLQQHGAAHGSGVYLSTQFSLSIAYARRSTSQLATENRFLKETLALIALCEVANAPTLRKALGNIWVAPDEDCVITRFLFVFCGDGVAHVLSPMGKSSESEDFRKHVQQVLDEYKTNG
ncbi:hypothetical protein M885DRAFT_539208 [Pelagophyceae sp. CCMP2097]|nr:hypothetical protein M885DRAFT_539208 [Pelagophyceae sp. CCMP2097]